MTRAIFTILIALLPFLYQYASPISVLSLGEMLLFPFIFCYIVSELKKGSAKNRFYGYFILLEFVVLFNFLACLIQPFSSFEESATVLARLIYYGALVYVARSHLKIELLLRALVLFTTLNSVYLLTQYISHEYIGYNLPTTIPHLPVLEDEADSVRLNLDLYYSWSFRPSGLFLEPSYAAFFMMPGLAILLLREEFDKRKYKIPLAALISIAMLLGTSSTAFIALILVWTSYAVKLLSARKRGGQLNISPIGIIIAIICATLLIAAITSPLGASMVGRITSGGSFGERVLRGFIIIGSLDLRTFLVGTGLNNISEYVGYYSVYTPYDEVNLDYVATFAGTLISSGVFVFIGYILFFGKLFKTRKGYAEMVILLFFMACCIFEATAYSYRFAFMLIILFAMEDMRCSSKKTIAKNQSIPVEAVGGVQ